MESVSTINLVFVYGTLRRGASNAWRMKDAVFISPAIACGTLYKISWYPVFIPNESSESHVVGELYQVTPETLLELDEFEGDEYLRKMITVHGDDDARIQAWAWCFKEIPASEKIIPSGDWTSTDLFAG